MRSLYGAGSVAAKDLPSFGNAPGKWTIAGSQAGQVGSLPLSWQEQTPYLTIIDIMRARRDLGLLNRN